MSDGLVLARKVGYEDWVRLPAAIDAMAIPPISPISSATLRYPPQRRSNVARNRYQVTRRTWFIGVRSWEDLRIAV
jgi:hypothetical protein